MKEKVRIIDIQHAISDAWLDTEYREALAKAMIVLGYVSDTPLKLSIGTPEQRKELKEVKERPLTSNQLSEIIHLMMYKMRNDFQYGTFKPIVSKFLNISEKMKNENPKSNSNKEIKVKPKCNIRKAYGNIFEIMGMASQKLKENNMEDESREMIERATKTYSYDEAFDVVNEYVETYEKSKIEEEEEEFE